jgi:hypothetical protein
MAVLSGVGMTKSYHRRQTRRTRQLNAERSPHGNSLPITQSRLLRSLGFDPQTAKELEERIESNRHLDLAFSKQ